MSNPRVKGHGITMAHRLPPLLRSSLCLAVVGLLAACASGAPGTGSASASVPAVTAATASPTPGFPAVLTDDAGDRLSFAAAPRRIVSLAPSNTELACAVGACDRVVGVTDFDDFPPQVKTIPKVVVQAVVDVEKVAAARPDLVLAAGNGLTPVAVIGQIRRLGMRVLTLYPRDLGGVYADLRLVGRAVGRMDLAEARVREMTARVKQVTDAVAGAPRPRTFYEVSVYQGTIYTAGRDSFIASLISLAGGQPVTGDPRSTAIQLEDLVKADPELIILGDASYDRSLTVASVGRRPGWESLSAVRTGRVIPFDADNVVTRPGPRVVDGLFALARVIHPDRFH